MNVKVVGVDLVENVFQVCVFLNDSHITWIRKIMHTKLLHTLRQFPSNLNQPMKIGWLSIVHMFCACLILNSL